MVLLGRVRVASGGGEGGCQQDQSQGLADVIEGYSLAGFIPLAIQVSVTRHQCVGGGGGQPAL